MRRTFLAAALLCAMIPARGDAVHYWNCGGLWRNTGTCGFAVRGAPLMVRGEATSTGTARVHVTVFTEVQGNEIVLLECSDEHRSQAQCSARLSEETVDLLVGSLPLTCRVTGSSAGTYGCASVNFD